MPGAVISAIGASGCNPLRLPPVSASLAAARTSIEIVAPRALNPFDARASCKSSNPTSVACVGVPRASPSR